VRLLQHRTPGLPNPTVPSRTQEVAMPVSIQDDRCIFLSANGHVLVYWPYQTNGKCTDHCKEQGTFAFAVIKWDNCWCTNYIPSTTTDITKCQKNCPGYPSEKCGDKDNGLYIYIEMAGQPSGTAGGGSQPSSTKASAPSSTDPPSSTDVATVSTSASLFASST
jgi:hypothetical protein